MPIPEKPLELDVDFEELTLEEMALFDAESAEDNPFGFINKMRKFLLNYSTSWRRAEINAIKNKDLEALTPVVISAIEAAAVPKENSPD